MRKNFCIDVKGDELFLEDLYKGLIEHLKSNIELKLRDESSKGVAFKSFIDSECTAQLSLNRKSGQTRCLANIVKEELENNNSVLYISSTLESTIEFKNRMKQLGITKGFTTYSVYQNPNVLRGIDGPNLIIMDHYNIYKHRDFSYLFEMIIQPAMAGMIHSYPVVLKV